MAKRGAARLYDVSEINEATLKAIKDDISGFSRYLLGVAAGEINGLKKEIEGLNSSARALNNAIERVGVLINKGRSSETVLNDLKKAVGSLGGIGPEIREARKDLKTLRGTIKGRVKELDKEMANLFSAYERKLKELEKNVPALIKEGEYLYKAQRGYEFKEARSEEEKRRIILETGGKRGFFRRIFR